MTAINKTSDRELLEMAAKALWPNEDEVRFRFLFDEDEGAIVFISPDYQDRNGADVTLIWNPLEDDGDALRLAVKLNLDILQDRLALKSNTVEVVANEYGDEEQMIWAWEQRAPDPLSATRRAIVRAAASIGAAL